MDGNTHLRVFTKEIEREQVGFDPAVSDKKSQLRRHRTVHCRPLRPLEKSEKYVGHNREACVGAHHSFDAVTNRVGDWGDLLQDEERSQHIAKPANHFVSVFSAKTRKTSSISVLN